MDQKIYVTKEQGELLSFPYDWKQTFEHSFEMARVSSEAFTIKAFVSASDERQMGLEILILLLDYTFATRKQIKRLLQLKGILPDGDLPEADEQLDALLRKYLDTRLLNCFTLSAYEMESIPDDAFIIYCLDHGARHILSHFYHDDVAITWKSTNALRSAELVSKYLVTNEFYLSLLTSKGSSLSSFQPTADFKIRSRDIRFSATFRLQKGATPVDCILEVVRRSDLPINWRKKTNEQIAPFIMEKFWNRYFRLEPMMIFIAEDLAQAEELAEIFYLRTESTMFRVTIDNELLKGMDQAFLYKYVPENEIGSRLTPVEAKIFKA